MIKNYLPLEQAEESVSEMWSMMERLSDGKLDRKKVETQGDIDNYPPIHHGGMIQYIGHSQTQWKLRKSVRQIFVKLWNTEELKTSFDGMCFMNGLLHYEEREENEGLHVDQPPIKNKLWSYQGIMTLTDAV